MKKLVGFFIFWVVSVVAFGAEPTNISFKSKIGEKSVEYKLDETKTKPDQLQFFLKKSQNILKFKSHDSKFCPNEKFELSVTEGAKKKSILACARSKTKLTQEMKKLANLLSVQYAEP
jgi:hypothetical protein